jgi:hypothetical protein
MAKKMATIYCLYSTREGRPRYVGRTSKGLATRYRQHELNAADGNTDQLVHEWMREEWLAGYETQIFPIKRGGSGCRRQYD